MSAAVFPFGALSDGTPVTAARIENDAGASLTVLNYGATIQSLRVPGRGGAFVDVVLGFDSAVEYGAGADYLGATVGRVANRIGGAKFTLGGKTYSLAKNDGENHLHGGVRGFDKRIWAIAATEDSVVCERLSPDGEEGYPGDLHTRVTFALTQGSALRITYDVYAGADTPVNLTNHAYFNLNGGGSAMEHVLQIFADRFCENDEHCLPTGRLLSVTGTPFDFREAKPVGRDIDAENEQLRRGGGYDHNFCLSGRRAAVLSSEESGIVMTVETDLPGMQLYTANFLSENPGKNGVRMARRGAVCLETQLYPNAMNCWGFPTPILRAGRHMHSETVYAFSVL